jgi:hypothetical protein
MRAPDFLWWGMTAAGSGYLALFLATDASVSLRLGRLGWMMMAVLVARAGLLGLGYRLESGFDTGMAAVTTLGTVVLRLAARVWLVRATRDELNDEIRTACRGLFVRCEGPQQGRFRLYARHSMRELRVAELSSGLQLVVLPTGIGERKMALLVCWFSKRHPGPVPRLRIDLARRTS